MRPRGKPGEPGPLFRFFADDHRRLDEILRRAGTPRGRVDAALFEQFRGGLLRHIGMEEKVLLPAARAARGGAALAVARLLRTDHGAIAALLVPTPTPEVLERILSVLGPHNALEEEPDGLYETCDRLLADEAAALLEKLRAFPEVPMAPHQDSPLVEKHIAETLALARKARASDERVFRAETLRATGEDPLAATSYEPGARRRRDPEDRRLSRADYEGRREKMFDKTVADSFPASDPPSSLPDPSEDSFEPAGLPAEDDDS